MSVKVVRNKKADVVINMAEMFKASGSLGKDISKGRLAVRMVTSPFTKAARLCGFNNRANVAINLEDENGDGVTNITVLGGNEFILRNNQGTVVGKNSNTNSGVVKTTNTFNLPAGEYNLEVIGNE